MDGCVEKNYGKKAGILIGKHESMVIKDYLFYVHFIRSQFDITFSDLNKPLSIDAFKISKRVIQTFDSSKDKERLEIYSRYTQSITLQLVLLVYDC